MQVQNMKISDIKPYPNNPRDNDDGVEAVANSINEFGWQQPIVVDKDNVIIVGHTRYKAAEQLQLQEVPVVVADNLSDEQVKAYRLADNKTGELSDWDTSLLDDELADILDIDMSDFGFDDGLDDEDMLITDGDDHTEASTNWLKACGYQIEMTEHEYQELKKRIDEYADENGVLFGFVEELLHNAS